MASICTVGLHRPWPTNLSMRRPVSNKATITANKEVSSQKAGRLTGLNMAAAPGKSPTARIPPIIRSADPACYLPDMNRGNQLAATITKPHASER